VSFALPVKCLFAESFPNLAETPGTGPSRAERNGTKRKVSESFGTKRNETESFGKFWNETERFATGSKSVTPWPPMHFLFCAANPASPSCFAALLRRGFAGTGFAGTGYAGQASRTLLSANGPACPPCRGSDRPRNVPCSLTYNLSPLTSRGGRAATHASRTYRPRACLRAQTCCHNDPCGRNSRPGRRPKISFSRDFIGRGG